MTLSPLSEKDLLNLIAEGEDRLDPQQHRLWNLIKIVPEKWSAGDYGKKTKGFWAVGVFGNQVLWYNEIEEGFNLSTYSKFGHIDECWCNQDELAHVLYRLSCQLEGRSVSSIRRGSPEPGK